MTTLADFFEMIFHAIEFIFQIQADIWDEFGIFPTFMLMFIAAVFFRYIILRMFGAGEAGISDYVTASARADAATARQQENYRRAIKLSERRAQIQRAYRRKKSK